MSDRDGDRDIYVVTLDGSAPRRLTFSEQFDDVPSFSPDGSRMAYEHDGVVWVMNSDGSNQHQVGWYYTYRPSWSRDGRRLVFHGIPPGQSGTAIFTSDPNGRDVKQVSLNMDGALAAMASFSPDGSRIAFERSNHIWLVNSDGTNEHAISADLDGQVPAWSPTGSEIVFQWADLNPPYNSVGPGDDLYAVRPDGTGLRQLTAMPGSDTAAAWSADGRRIAFGSQRHGNGELYVMNADGGGATRITNDGETVYAPFDGAPSWDPTSGSGAPPALPPSPPGAAHPRHRQRLALRCAKRQEVGRRGVVRLRVFATQGSVVVARGALIVTKRFTVGGAKARTVRLRLRHRARARLARASGRLVARIRLTARAPDGVRTSATAVTALR